MLIDKVSELAGIDFRKDLYLREQITNHMKPMVYRLKNGINIENQTTEEIKKRYSILFHIVWLASKTVSDSYQLEFLNAEIAFLTIYFEIAVERLEKPLHIYVVCPHGLATSELIINSLKRIISSYDYLQKIDLVDVTDQLALKADIIISSVLLENFDHPYILVSPLLSQEENDIIQREYRRLTDGNRKILSVVKNEKQLNHSIIRNLLGQNIHLQKECQTKETCMSFLVSQAYEENRQAPSFLQSILERERLGSTSIYTGIALPHANPQKVQKSQLSLLTLKEPIEWGQNMVKVVLLIAIKEGEEEHCKEALIYLYSKIDDLDFINKLAKATDKYDVYTTLFLEEK
ncbi:PTS sugar transporter subunit IIA [Streptococcus didelphis]|uniref:BglG family transcription antiterminator n=1 Tax=Streptococcus didelphis TaxID=102886 RepID=UPI0027D24980|nr:PTS sugar transporter subunit IIA [Streptococcus didelphis]WMB29517.1 PTS sugar transporter subunit IIA [Streptococcus didelphis]